MKIGILVCDSVEPTLAAQFGEFADMIQRGLSACSQYQYVLFDAVNMQLPPADDDCDGYIITGSTDDAYADKPWINHLARWIRHCDQQRKPLIGICFGHQIIALALGGRVEKSAKGWGVGVSRANRIMLDLPWMQPNKPLLDLLVFHQDQVIELPASMQVVASSEFCPNYMLAKDQHILTIQGHPEFSPEFEHGLLTYMQSVIGEAHYKAAVNSLSTAPDSALVMRWLSNFLHFAVAAQSLERESEVLL